MAYQVKCKSLNLPEVRKKRNIGKYRVTTKKDALKYVYDNLAEKIEITEMNQVLSTDTTELKLKEEGKQHISFVIDAYTSEILSSCISKKLDNNFINLILGLLKKNNYDFEDVIIHSDRGGMYKSGDYKKITTELKLIPSMSAPFSYTHNPWIESINGQFKDFIKSNYPKNLNELQIALKQFVHYNNNIKIKQKLKMTPIKYRCHRS